MLWIKWNPKEVICDDCRQEMGLHPDALRMLTEQDVADSVDYDDESEQMKIGLPPVCAYCGWEAPVEDLPNGT